MTYKKLWGGAFEQSASADLENFWSSISFDQRLAEIDIQGSIAHAHMLGVQNIISQNEANEIIRGLQDVLVDIQAGKVEFRATDEDIHLNIERILTEKIGAVAGKLHTARSRNDQSALDMHIYVRTSCLKTSALLQELVRVFLTLAQDHKNVIMPGYTHLQRAQPVLFAHHMMAYGWMFLRDIERLKNCAQGARFSPLGAGAIAGTTFDIDRLATAKALGFEAPYPNSMDAVSNRDHIIELLSTNAIIAAHLSRLCEEIVLWTSSEFNFIKLPDAYCTGSSMMPQKKNADLAELVRGKTGRVYGALVTMLTVLKGLPLTYNKDFQEDKECLFDSVDTVQRSLFHVTGMMKGIKINPDVMLKATREGFLNATDVADYLAIKGLPFRQAHEVTGKIVLACVQSGKTIDDMSLDEFKKFNSIFEDDIFTAIKIENVVARRHSYGGTSPQAVEAQMIELRAALDKAL